MELDSFLVAHGHLGDVRNAFDRLSAEAKAIVTAWWTGKWSSYMVTHGGGDGDAVAGRVARQFIASFSEANLKVAEDALKARNRARHAHAAAPPAPVEEEEIEQFSCSIASSSSLSRTKSKGRESEPFTTGHTHTHTS